MRSTYKSDLFPAVKVSTAFFAVDLKEWKGQKRSHLWNLRYANGFSRAPPPFALDKTHGLARRRLRWWGEALSSEHEARPLLSTLRRSQEGDGATTLGKTLHGIPVEIPFGNFRR